MLYSGCSAKLCSGARYRIPEGCGDDSAGGTLIGGYMSEEEIKNHKIVIDNMSHYGMAELFRFAPAGHPYFDRTNPLNEYFMDKFTKLGMITPELSKEIGWERQ